MSLSSQAISSSLGLAKSDIENLLVLLYKLTKHNTSSLPFTEYEYNYNYVPPLALTGATSLPIIQVELPIQELPNLKWVILVAQKLTLILVNDALSKFSGFFENGISYGVDNDAQSNSLALNIKVQSLEDIEQRIKDAESKQDLEEIALKLASITQDITEQLVAANPSNVVSSDSGEISAFEEQLQEIDEQFELYQIGVNSGNIGFSSPSELEDSITDLLSSAFKKIIKSNAKLLELENTQPLPIEVEFSTQASTTEPSLEDYNKLFIKIPLPEISARFQEDLVFAYMQVAGPNPLMLQKVSEQEQLLQITNEQYQQIIGTSDSLEVAKKEGRLYKADYSKLKNMENGNFPNRQKYIYSPLALFAVPPSSSSSRSLIPVAIQYQPQDPVFTPLNGDNWAIAKSIVQMADSNYHELVSHLGRTHLFIEPFVIATKRRLPASHHLRILLEPHFEGTILINYGAHKILIAPGREVDAILASKIESDRQLTVEAAQDYLHHFNDLIFPQILANRGVNNTSQLPEYPYRDDGLLIWNAIHKWVRAYLSSYYTNEQQILADQALQNWAKELISEQGGRLQNFGEDISGTIKTLDYLIDAVSTIIFIASAQHAAVNFPQSQLMTYAPAFPLAVYSPAPTNLDQPGDFMRILPPLDQAKTQLKLTYLLGSVYYTQLGQYSNSYFKSKPELSSALLAFQNELKGIEQEINQKNSKRIMPYKFLLPSQIPQSINI
ncbi:lipoxygenase [Nostoc sp. C052]|uniref:lipoxygenase family protein n=1 Tax=Nostoc sp. C052 TaxID=2576902 RepID=UPI0015C30BA1|nr:lipoxygenase family protein [Nostoc sp. C052]QLE44179.1 lipoxygenase [Nostoc sp. C052]